MATVFVPKIESGEWVDVPKVELGEQRVKFKNLVNILDNSISWVLGEGNRGEKKVAGALAELLNM